MQVNDVERKRFQLQLRITQAVAVVGVALSVVGFVRSSRSPDFRVGGTSVSARGFETPGGRLDGEGLILLGPGSKSSSAVTASAHATGPYITLVSGDVSAEHKVEKAARSVSLVVSGRLRTEIRINADTGAVSVVRNRDLLGGAASEEVVPLVPPLGQ